MANRIPEDPEARRRRERERLAAHRGQATWGEKLVPLATFRRATAALGRRLSPEEREAARQAYLAGPGRVGEGGAGAGAAGTGLAGGDPTPVEGPFGRVAVFGGVYNNHRALAALLEDAHRRGAEAVYCLGDLGGFGPHPDAVWPLLEQGAVRTLQGNYEESLASGREDCNCGYTDPRDNHFAGLSYGYTERRTAPAFKRWMGELPKRRRVLLGDRELLLVHGSPRRTNEFLFRSTTPVAFLEVLLDQQRADALLCTHTGLHWHRRLPSGRDAVNVGVIGRPANDGRTEVWYALLDAPAPGGGPGGGPGSGAGGGPGGGRGTERGDGLGVELVPLPYDHQALAEEMRREELPEEFVETILTGWWTTCLEILPAKERAASRY